MNRSWSRCGCLVTLIAWAMALAGCQSSRSAGSGTVFSKSRTSDDDPDLNRRVEAMAAFSTGIVLTERDEPEAAYEQFARAAEKDPANEAIAIDIARHHLQRNQPEEAIQVLQRTAAQPGASGVVKALLAETLWSQGQAEGAVRAYEDAIRVAPTLLGAYQQLAVIHVERRQTNQALGVLERSLAVASDDANYWLNVADLFTWFNQVDSSQRPRIRSDLRKALERADGAKPQAPADILRLGRGFLEIGENARAEALFQQLNDSAPKNPAVAANLAELLIRDGRLKEARQHLELLSRANPTSHFPWYFLGVIDLEEKNEAEAARMFQRSIQLKPDFEPAYSELAVALLNQNQAKEALDALRQGLDRFPTSFRLVYLTAMAEARLEHYDRAFQAFKKAEALAADNATELLNERFYFQVGAILGQAGREEESVEYLEKAIALDPEFDEALNHLGYTWAEKGKNLDRALDLIERAVKQDPENAAYLDSLGWVLFKLGRTSEALPHLERAAALLTEPDATVYDHLGDVLAALGRMAEAKEAWRKSVAVEKSDTVQRKLDGAP